MEVDDVFLDSAGACQRRFVPPAQAAPRLVAEACRASTDAALNFASSLGASHEHLGWRGYVAEIAALSAARP
jgi:hypothetical protein